MMKILHVRLEMIGLGLLKSILCCNCDKIFKGEGENVS